MAILIQWTYNVYLKAWQRRMRQGTATVWETYDATWSARVDLGHGTLAESHLASFTDAEQWCMAHDIAPTNAAPPDGGERKRDEDKQCHVVERDRASVASLWTYDRSTRHHTCSMGPCTVTIWYEAQGWAAIIQNGQRWLERGGFPSFLESVHWSEAEAQNVIQSA